MITPDLFLDCVLYIINENTDASRELVLELISLFETDVKNTMVSDQDIMKFYVRILRSIIDTKVTKKNRDELRIVLLRFQSDTFLSKRTEIYSLLHDTFMSEESLSKEDISRYTNRIKNALVWHRCNKVSRALYGTLARAGDMVSPHDQAEELKKLRTYTREIDTVFAEKTTTQINTSLVERIDLSDRDSMSAAQQKYKERAVKGVLKTGLHGLNRMLGSRRGLIRGESAVFYALPHHYKSGMIMSIAGWVVLHNTPSLSGSEGNKKPLVLLISLENEAYQNFTWMYRHFYETQNQKSSSHLTDDEVTEWAYSAFNTKGYTLLIERHLPSKFNYPQFVKTIEMYENSGFRIVLVAVDYLNLMAKDGLPPEAGLRYDLAVRGLFSAMCNYTKTEGITFVSAHPLHRRAKELASSGITNVVKRLDTSHLADSFDVAREVDFEVFIHIERNLEGTAYLTMQRGKHRYVDDTPLAHQYCAYRFNSFGIRDDVTGSIDESVTDIFSDPRSSEGIKGAPSQPKEQESEEESLVIF